MTAIPLIFEKHRLAREFDWTWDIEASGLLDESTVDFTASPYKLRESFSMHCIVFQNHFTGEIVAFHDGPKYVFDGREYSERLEKASAASGKEYIATLQDYKTLDYTHYPLSNFRAWVAAQRIRRLVAHNQVAYDLVVTKAYFGMPYSIGDEHREGGFTTYSSDTWDGKKLSIWDTLVLSKTLNPDRYGGHSLDKLASGGSYEKIQFRKHMDESIRFLDFAADMLYYCIYDVLANTAVYYGLLDGTKNKLDPKTPGPDLSNPEELHRWASALKLEHNVAEIITRQQYRGFWFDRELAQKNLDELDALMEERRQKVEPILPPRPATKGFMKEYTPPKVQFKKNGDISSHMEKFIAKHGGVYDAETRTVFLLGKQHSLPLPEGVPLLEEMPATINDTTHIKNWLVSLGWNPSEYKEKDLTTDTKKNKLEGDKLIEAVDRYLDQTFELAFKSDRLEHLAEKGLPVSTTSSKAFVRAQILKRVTERKSALKVLSNPSFTKGQDKEMCPDLDRLTEKFPFAKEVVEYMTYKHRRNSILGGGIDWDDPDEEPEKGYIASVREDGRIETPADTCGAATSRFKHRKVANIPRVTSLYGEQLRALFGVDKDFFQIGYDFDSLEARIESAYCWQYDGVDKAYCKSLMMEKPFDVHTMMAKKISEIIGRDFGRSPAKNVKYGCTYGAQAAKVAKTIGSDLSTGQIVFDAFWLAAMPLKLLKEALAAEWEANGKKYIIGIDGRRVPTRSAHAILNSLFQSGGVICAKRAMVIHDRKLKAEGLSVDFWLDDWKVKKFCQQLIAYHDEAQLEASRELFVFRTFDSKEDAQAFKDAELESTGKVWSDISHGKGEKFYVAYCRAGELAVQSVSEAGQFYSTEIVPIDLTAGYIVNRTWAGCH